MSILNSLTEAQAPAARPAGAIPVTTYPARTRKTAPLHPGEVVADLLEANGLSMRQAAKAVGMSPNGFDKVIKGKSPVTPETALRLARYFGGKHEAPELWLNMQRDYDLWRARREIASELDKIETIGRAR